MFIDITVDDISTAKARLVTYDRWHNWHNPLAIALDRKYGHMAALVTPTTAHIFSDGIVGRFDLTDAARSYLADFFNGQAFPVERLQPFYFTKHR